LQGGKSLTCRKKKLAKKSIYQTRRGAEPKRKTPKGNVADKAFQTQKTKTKTKPKQRKGQSSVQKKKKSKKLKYLPAVKKRDRGDRTKRKRTIQRK